MAKGITCAFCGRGPEYSLGDMLGPFYEELPQQHQSLMMQHHVQQQQQRAADAQLEDVAGNTSGTLYVHRLCALWSPEVYVSPETGKLRNVLAAVRRGRALRCHFCHEPGATLGCFVESCPRSYHVPCAQQDGCSFRMQNFIMACPMHRKRLPHSRVDDDAVGVGDGSGRYCPLADSTRTAGAATTSGRGYDQRSRYASTGIADVYGGHGRNTRRVVTSRDMKRQIRSNEIAATAAAAAAAAAAANGHGQLPRRPPGWDDDDEFRAKNVRSLAKDAVRMVPIFLGPTRPETATSSDADAKLQALLLSEEDAGLEAVLAHGPATRALREAVILPLLYPDVLERMGVTPPRGVLLHGPPGTGKTLAVRAMATVAARICTKVSDARTDPQHIAFYHRKAADCLGKFHGQAERTLRLLFASAIENAPSIIFIDEIDGLLPARDGGNGASSSFGQDHLHTSVVTTMLALMDDMKDRGNVVVIGATNRLESLDPALRRPGRFDREVCCPLPTRYEREKIIALYTHTWDPRPCAATVTAVATATKGYAGADLRALCSSAMMHALTRTKPRLFRELMDEETLHCMLAATALQKHRAAQKKKKEEEEEAGDTDAHDDGNQHAHINGKHADGNQTPATPTLRASSPLPPPSPPLPSNEGTAADIFITEDAVRDEHADDLVGALDEQEPTLALGKADENEDNDDCDDGNNDGDAAHTEIGNQPSSIRLDGGVEQVHLVHDKEEDADRMLVNDAVHIENVIYQETERKDDREQEQHEPTHEEDALQQQQQQQQQEEEEEEVDVEDVRIHMQAGNGHMQVDETEHELQIVEDDFRQRQQPPEDLHNEEKHCKKEMDTSDGAPRADTTDDKLLNVVSTLPMKVEVLPSDWRECMRRLPPPCSRRSANAASSAAVDVAGPIPYELAPVLVPALRLLLARLRISTGTSASSHPSSSSVALLNEAVRLVTTLSGESDVKCESELHRLGLVSPAPTRVSSSSSPPFRASESMSMPATHPTYEMRARMEEEDGRQCAQACNRDGTDSLRILIGGCGGVGQKELAACILHTLSVETVRTVSLPLLVAEGGGDAFRGMVTVLEDLHLSTAAAKISVVLYLPLLELWAEAVGDNDGEDAGANPSLVRKNAHGSGVEERRGASRAWDFFQRHVDAMVQHTCVHIVATSNTETDRLDGSIQAFFFGDSSNRQNTTETTTTTPTMTNASHPSLADSTLRVDLPEITRKQCVEVMQRGSRVVAERLLLHWLEMHQWEVSGVTENGVVDRLEDGGEKKDAETPPPPPSPVATAELCRDHGIEHGTGAYRVVPAYMSPERHKRSPMKVRRRNGETASDVVVVSEKEQLLLLSPHKGRSDADIRRSTALRHARSAIQSIGSKLLRDYRVTSLDEHLMTTEMYYSRTLRFVAQRATAGEYGTDASRMIKALHDAASAHHSVALRWMRRHKNLRDNEDAEALMAADGAKAAADEYSAKLFEVEKSVLEMRRKEEEAKLGDGGDGSVVGVDGNEKDAMMRKRYEDRAQLEAQVSRCAASLKNAVTKDTIASEASARARATAVRNIMGSEPEPSRALSSPSMSTLVDVERHVFHELRKLICAGTDRDDEHDTDTCDLRSVRVPTLASLCTTLRSVEKTTLVTINNALGGFFSVPECRRRRCSTQQ